MLDSTPAPAAASCSGPPVSGADRPPPAAPKLPNYMPGKGITQSYMNFTNTLLAEFLKQNVTIPGVMEEIDLTKDDAEKRRRARQNAASDNDHHAASKALATHTKIANLPMPPPPFTAPVMPPLPAAPPLPPDKQNELKKTHKKMANDVAKMVGKPSPKPQSVPSTSRGPKSLMSLPLPQTSNDSDDFISYSPASPVTPPPKTAKKGIMDLPLPPGELGR